jgi:peptidoglycan/LPS O-acetylase OafA/YrhL
MFTGWRNAIYLSKNTAVVSKTPARPLPHAGKIYFDNLDTIRFVAAAMVLFKHAISPCFIYLPIQNTVWAKFLDLISDGGAGVSIFFVLSGFLITWMLIGEHEATGNVNVKNFYMRRVLRIWPLYFAVIAFAFFVYPMLKSLIGVNSQLGTNVYYYLSFLSNFDVMNVNLNCAGKDAMTQTITWSVAIEEQFYLFWPLIFAFSPRRYWVHAILFTIIFSLTFRILNHNDNTVLYFHSFSVMIDLGIGALFAYAVKTNKTIKLFFENSSGKTHLLFVIVSFCLLFWGKELFAFEYGNAIMRLFVSISFAFIICAQAVTKKNSLLNFKNISFARKLGKYTYGIYLLHPIVLICVDVAVRLMHLPKDNFITLFSMGMAAIVLTIILSRVSYHYFEMKFLRLKEKFQ